ncbi:MAG TPA: aminoacyl-tRNA hydrolase [Kofleriaceae bacterium]|nr:aminoacyl-tRNA hydrolase [Kofleriaceae bacterium]
MWLVVGLGNPGAKYARNRHNIGFLVVDELAASHGLPVWKTGKLGGDTTSGVITTERGRERALLLKPMEYMNRSGFAVQRTADFHHIEPDRILVVHDEIDLELGVVRLKNGGGHGGHNGLRSIMEQLGHGKFARLRMGVGRDPNVPPGAASGANAVAGWVLSDFPQAQSSLVTAMIKAGCESIQTVLARGIGPAMNQHNARPKLSSPGTDA